MLRRSIVFLLDSMGWEARAYASAEAFLAESAPDRPGCLVLDIRMPTMSGLELQQALSQRGCELPIIFITGHGEVSGGAGDEVGACDFIEKTIPRPGPARCGGAGGQEKPGAGQ